MANRPSARYLLSKGLKLSLANIWRNKFLSVATIFVMAAIIFIFNIMLAINFIAQDSIASLSQKIDVTVYLKESTTYSQTTDIIHALQTLDTVDEVVYNTKDDALTKIKKTYPDISLAFEKYELGNPLPASLNIKTSDPKYHSEIAEFLAQDKYQVYLSNVVTDSGENNDGIITSVSRNLTKLTTFTKQLLFWLISTFLIGGALIILNALQITIFSRRKEIAIMKLVGASYAFIRLPYIIEATAYAILSIILSFTMLSGLAQNISIQISGNWIHVLLIELACTITLSITASMVAVHEYLLKKTI